jgi:hypothetical protein
MAAMVSMFASGFVSGSGMVLNQFRSPPPLVLREVLCDRRTPEFGAAKTIILSNTVVIVFSAREWRGTAVHIHRKGLILLKVKLRKRRFGPNATRDWKSFRSVALTVLLLFAVECSAQEPVQSAWQGVLHNAGGAPISGAKVRLAGKGAATEGSTGADGAFRLAPLPVGQYRLTVHANGRRVNYAQPIELGPAAPPVALTLSDRGELNVAVVQSQAGTGGEQLSSQAVSELPLNKRDFGTLLLLAAGTMTDANGATNFTAQFAINGQRGVEAVFAMDGADISDPEMGGATFANFNVDAVQEIQSSSGWMPAEIGRGAAGFTNIITRSGASGFHGSFFEFVRNSAFDARNYFDHETLAYPGRIPPFRRNEFGFTNGGPVYIPHVYDGRSRTFYFTQYQGFRQVLGTTQVMPLPTVAERLGQDTVTYPDGSTDTLTVPVDSGIKAVLARYPLPNNPGGSFQAHTYATASKVATNADQFSLRIDHRISSKDQFFARFAYDNLSGPTTNPDQTAIDPTSIASATWWVPGRARFRRA